MQHTHSVKVGQPKEFVKLRSFRVCKMDFPPESAVEMKSKLNMTEFLAKATEALQLQRQATTAYDENFVKIENIKDVLSGSLIYISCAKAQKERPVVPPKRYTSRTDKGLKLTLPLVEVPVVADAPEFQLQHQAIASSANTVKDNMRDAILAMFDSMPEEYREVMPEGEELYSLLYDTQFYLFQDMLVSEFISPSSNASLNPYYQQVYNLCFERVRGIKASDYKIAVTGPVQSGKSTTVNMLASLYFIKSQIGNQIESSFILPINFMQYQVDITDPSKLLHIYIPKCFRALKVQKPEYAPYIPFVQQWIQCVTQVALPTFPSNVVFTDPNTKAALVLLATKIHRLWTSRASLEDFVRATIRFPLDFAACFNFKTLLLVLDHYDCLNVNVENPQQFPDALGPVNIASAMNDFLEEVSFVVASSKDEEFFNCFKVKSFVEFSTLRMVADAPNKSINLVDLGYTLHSSICKGCPAYHVAFDRICNEVERMNQKAPSGIKFASFIDQARREACNQSIARFMSLFDTDEIPVDVLEEIQNTTALRASVQQ